MAVSPDRCPDAPDMCHSWSSCRAESRCHRFSPRIRHGVWTSIGCRRESRRAWCRHRSRGATVCDLSPRSALPRRWSNPNHPRGSSISSLLVDHRSPWDLPFIEWARAAPLYAARPIKHCGSQSLLLPPVYRNTRCFTGVHGGCSRQTDRKEKPRRACAPRGQTSCRQ